MSLARRLPVALALVATAAGGSLAAAGSAAVRTVEYKSGDLDIPAMLATPSGPGPHRGVVFVHGRSGLNERLRGEARRLAERGFVVLAPDYHTARFIAEMPIEHDPATEGDVERAVDVLRSLPGVGRGRIGVVGISRGGYHAALLGVRRQDVGAVVGYYPHLVSPNAAEPEQVYRYMPEVEQWRVPALLMVGELDHQLRRELVARVAERLKQRGVDVELVVYPGAQRAFDFRRNDRTLGDDLAREDALNRTVRFLNRVLSAGV